MRLLLDTCAFLWLGLDSENVSRDARATFLNSDNESYLSAASAWEIAIKYSIGRLWLPKAPDLFVGEGRERSGVAALPVDEESALLVGRLPRLHADPFDRILVAQAIVHGMVIVTPDEAIAKYGIRTIW